MVRFIASVSMVIISTISLSAIGRNETANEIMDQKEFDVQPIGVSNFDFDQFQNSTVFMAANNHIGLHENSLWDGQRSVMNLSTGNDYFFQNSILLPGYPESFILEKHLSVNDPSEKGPFSLYSLAENGDQEWIADVTLLNNKSDWVMYATNGEHIAALNHSTFDEVTSYVLNIVNVETESEQIIKIPLQMGEVAKSEYELFYSGQMIYLFTEIYYDRPNYRSKKYLYCIDSENDYEFERFELKADEQFDLLASYEFASMTVTENYMYFHFERYNEDFLYVLEIDSENQVQELDEVHLSQFGSIDIFSLASAGEGDFLIFSGRTVESTGVFRIDTKVAHIETLYVMDDSEAMLFDIRDMTCFENQLFVRTGNRLVVYSGIEPIEQFPLFYSDPFLTETQESMLHGFDDVFFADSGLSLTGLLEGEEDSYEAPFNSLGSEYGLLPHQLQQHAYDEWIRDKTNVQPFFGTLYKAIDLNNGKLLLYVDKGSGFYDQQLMLVNDEGIIEGVFETHHDLERIIYSEYYNSIFIFLYGYEGEAEWITFSTDDLSVVQHSLFRYFNSLELWVLNIAITEEGRIYLSTVDDQIFSVSPLSRDFFVE